MVTRFRRLYDHYKTPQLYVFGQGQFKPINTTEPVPQDVALDHWKQPVAMEGAWIFYLFTKDVEKVMGRPVEFTVREEEH